MAAKGALQPLLKYLRVPVQPLRQNIFSLTPHLFRSFSSEEVRGCFLDKSEVTDRVISVVKNFQKVDPSKVNPNSHFQNDLGLDSLDSVEIVMALEEEFGFEIPDNEADKINCINLAVDFIASHPQANSALYIKKIEGKTGSIIPRLKASAIILMELASTLKKKIQ